MTAADIAGVSAWAGALLLVAALAAGAAAAMSRTLLAMCLYLCAGLACVAAALVALGDGEAAFALAAGGVVWAPLLLLMGLSLGGRIAKSARRRRPWVSLLMIVVLAAAFVWAARGGASLPSDLLISIVRGDAPIGPWLAALAFAAACACVVLLGYGERGALQRNDAGSLE